MSFMEMLINKLDSLFIKATSKNLSPEEVERKIELRSQKREELWARKKQEYEAKKQEQARIAQKKRNKKNKK